MASTSGQGWFDRNAGTISTVGQVGFGMAGLFSNWAQYRASKAQAQAMEANANAMRKQAKADYDFDVSQELVLRQNQTSDMADARTVQGATGIMNTGSGEQRERTVAAQYEHAIGQQSVQRTNAYNSAMYQASMKDWEASQARKASKRGFASGILGTVVNTATMGLFK